jgi:hypothetical protein
VYGHTGNLLKISFHCIFLIYESDVRVLRKYPTGDLILREPNLSPELYDMRWVGPSSEVCGLLMHSRTSVSFWEFGSSEAGTDDKFDRIELAVTAM